MNLKELQTEIGAVAARLAQLQNELGRILGSVQGEDVSSPLRAGSVVVVEKVTEDATEAARRCFTVGNQYIVKDADEDDITFKRDDEFDEHTVGVDHLVLLVIK